jgi:Tfp pilus assembly protein PilN
MRAVNLIPGDVRPGAGGAAGKSGGAAYALLGVLAVIVAMFAVYTKVNASIDDKTVKVASLEQQASAAEAQATALASYTRFAALRTKRVATVKQLAGGRFDWAHALHELARVLPANVWLTDLTGTTSPSVRVDGAGSSTNGLRTALPVPAIEITGCTTSQASVAKMMARMRLIDGVQRVSLVDAEKSDSATSGGDSATGGGGCNVSTHFPTFHLIVFFEAQPGAAAGATPGGSGPTPAAATGTTPTATTPTATTATGTSPSTPATTGVTK